MKKLLIAVALIVAVAVGTAFYLGWLSFSTTHSLDNSRSDLTLTLDKEKVKEDIDAVKKQAKEAKEKISEGARDLKNEIKEKASEAKERVDEAVHGKTIEGKVQSMDVAKSELTVVGSDGKEAVTVKVNADTKVRVENRDGSMADVKNGDSVNVTHLKKDGVDVAVLIVVKARS